MKSLNELRTAITVVAIANSLGCGVTVNDSSPDMSPVKPPVVETASVPFQTCVRQGPAPSDPIFSIDPPMGSSKIAIKTNVMNLASKCLMKGTALSYSETFSCDVKTDDKNLAQLAMSPQLYLRTLESFDLPNLFLGANIDDMLNLSIHGQILIGSTKFSSPRISFANTKSPSAMPDLAVNGQINQMQLPSPAIPTTIQLRLDLQCATIRISSTYSTIDPKWTIDNIQLSSSPNFP